jgi:putative addiction module antidote
MGYNLSPMKTKVRKIGNGYGVLLPKQVIERLRVAEGSVLNISETSSGIQLSPFDADFSDQVDAFRNTEARHRNSYRELAK